MACEGSRRRCMKTISSANIAQECDSALTTRVIICYTAYVADGEMSEWLMEAVLKTVVSRGTGGSNPSLSAKKRPRDGIVLRVFCLPGFGRAGGNLCGAKPLFYAKNCIIMF